MYMYVRIYAIYGNVLHAHLHKPTLKHDIQCKPVVALNVIIYRFVASVKSMNVLSKLHVKILIEVCFMSLNVMLNL